MMSSVKDRYSTCESREWGVMEDFIAKVTSKLRPEGWVWIGQRKHGQEGPPTTKNRCAWFEIGKHLVLVKK